MPQAEGIGHVLFKQRSQDAGADIVFEVADTTCWAHSIVVTKRSPIFAALFNGGFVEGRERRCKVEDCSVEDFHQFLHLVYTGEFCTDEPLGARVLASATHVLLPKLLRLQPIPPEDGTELRRLLTDWKVRVLHSDREDGHWISSCDPELLRALRAMPSMKMDKPTFGQLNSAHSAVKRTLAVMRLLDRYIVDGFGDICVARLQVLVTWGSSLYYVVRHQLQFPVDSAHHLALDSVCKQLVGRADVSERDINEFLHGYKILPVRGTESLRDVSACLQILKWQMDWVSTNAAAVPDAYAERCRLTISQSIQEVVKRLNQCPDVPLPTEGVPEKKRKRVQDASA
eukprot:TRINITY_DN63855_c0_g1_i2.p1 TRINITY_DN63855_c0_g1~~TRINITY_DN63855_c0_g1_i2.p1  ORF type:complete len:342 (-),score=23.70 TRINITY_DN63855_c0_g1_i2:71-1096(-)